MADDPREGPENLDVPPSFFPYGADDVVLSGEPISRKLVEIHFDHIVVSESDDQRQYFVLLTDGNRHLMIVIGGFEATAIGLAADGAKTDRPMTHDLLVRFLEVLGGKLDRVVIDDLWSQTYFAKMYVKKGSEEIEVDARPSDAIAVAVRLGVPIYAIEGILRD